MKLWKSLLVVLMFSSLFVDSILAINPESELTFSPDEKVKRETGFYILDVKRGESVSVNFHVSNVVDHEVKFRIYPTDVTPSTRGGMNVRSSEEENNFVGTWFKEPMREIILRPGEKRTFNFNATVPKGIEDGQYNGAIAIEEGNLGSISVSGEQLGESFSPKAQFEIDPVVTTGIQVVFRINYQDSKHILELPDPEYGFRKTGRFFLDVPFENQGTILEKPRGVFKLTNSKGEILAGESYEMGSVYPKTTGIFDYEPNVIMYPGTYTLSYNAIYTNNEKYKEFTFTIGEDEFNQASQDSENSGLTTGSKWDKILSHLAERWWVYVIFLMLPLFIWLFILWKKRKKEEEEKGKFLDENYF